MKAYVYESGKDIIIDIRPEKGKDLLTLDKLFKKVKVLIMQVDWKTDPIDLKHFLRLKI